MDEKQRRRWENMVAFANYFALFALVGAVLYVVSGLVRGLGMDAWDAAMSRFGWAVVLLAVAFGLRRGSRWLQNQLMERRSATLREAPPHEEE